MTALSLVRPLLGTLLLLLLSASCGGRETAPPASEGQNTTGGVTVYDPRAAWNGYTLAFYRRQHPILVDMRGNVVHAWPEVRMKSRVRLTADCTLLGISAGRAVVEHDWAGHKIWSAGFENRFPHHDVIRLTNGNTMFLSRADGDRGDDVFEVDGGGEIVWEWRSLEPLATYIDARRGRSPGDPIHLNSVQELPDNPWFRAGDLRFRPGNLLLSARNLNLVLIVDRESRDVVWTYTGGLSLQHEALMAEPGSGRDGHILIFDNRYKSFWTDRRSEIVEIDPRDGSPVWRYSSLGFFAETAGSQLPLPNGNVLIASSNNGRAFEVDRAGRTVWEWAPGYRLNRPQRYARDHCPELGRLPPADGPPVRPPGGHRYVDRDSYRFARPGQLTDVTIEGVERRVLAPDSRCAYVVIPGDGVAALGFGIDRARVERLGLTDYAATFSLVLGSPDSEQSVAVFTETVDRSGPGWRERTVGLGALAHRRVEMCVTAAETGLDGKIAAGRLAFWSAPAIREGRDEAGDEADDGPSDLTAEELEVRLEHLRAMGYVN